MNTITAADILADLQKTFGTKRLLSPKEVAEVLGRSERAIYNLKHRRKLPIPVVELGGLLGFSIYHLAEYLAGGVAPLEDIPEDAPKKPTTTREPRGRRRVKGMYDHLFQWHAHAWMAIETKRVELEAVRELARIVGMQLPEYPCKGSSSKPDGYWGE